MNYLFSQGDIPMFFGLISVDKSEPRIVALEAPIKMVGVSMRTGMKTIYKDAPVLGKKYRKITEQGLIKNKKLPRTFVAISKNFSSDNRSWEYLMGDVVTTFDEAPKNLIAFEIPAKTFAVFSMRSRFRFLWGPIIGMTKKFIFTEWLPNSGYEADSSILGDFELHDERSTSKNPTIELYVPIKERGH
jgi:AraC family transcriptional regulator